MTITTHPSRLPEREPTSHTAVVLLDGEAWAYTGAQWESPRDFGSWGELRDLAAAEGGATMFDLADLPTGLTEAQKEAVRGAAECFNCAKCHALRDAFPEVFADDLVSATWKSGDPIVLAAESSTRRPPHPNSWAVGSMSEHELPDFTTATAWMDALGGVVAQRQVMDYKGPLGDFSAGAPWTPLDTADEWARHIDRDKLAEMLKRLDPLGDERCYASDEEYREYADAVLAALPELTGGERA